MLNFPTEACVSIIFETKKRVLPTQKLVGSARYRNPRGAYIQRRYAVYTECKTSQEGGATKKTQQEGCSFIEEESVAATEGKDQSDGKGTGGIQWIQSTTASRRTYSRYLNQMGFKFLQARKKDY